MSESESEKKRPALEEMEQWAKANRGPTARAHHAAFMAIRDDVAATLQAGWKLKDIWSMHLSKKRISMSYRTFCNHCQSARLKRVSMKPRRPSRLSSSGRQGPGSKRYIHNPSPDLEKLTGVKHD